MKIYSHLRFFSAVLVIAAIMQACGGGGATMDARTTTVGQELIDLEKAYKEGILTEKEYNEQKEAILERD